MKLDIDKRAAMKACGVVPSYDSHNSAVAGGVVTCTTCIICHLGLADDEYCDNCPHRVLAGMINDGKTPEEVQAWVNERLGN